QQFDPGLYEACRIEARHRSFRRGHPDLDELVVPGRQAEIAVDIDVDALAAEIIEARADEARLARRRHLEVALVSDVGISAELAELEHVAPRPRQLIFDHL